MKDKIKLTLQLCKYFLDKVDPEIIILFIHNNVYKLLKEMKHLPHTGAYEDFHHELNIFYLEYYREVIEPKNENWLYFLFPDPHISGYTLQHFSFKKFYIGLTCRIHFWHCTHYRYNDPINWTIGYNFRYDEEKVYTYNCQYILLENYNEFEIIESIGSEQLATYAYVLYKKENKDHQRVPEFEETRKYKLCKKYTKIKSLKRILSSMRKYFDEYLNPKIIEMCREISKNRPQDWYRRVRPIWSLEEELKKKMKPLLEEEKAEIMKELGLEKK